MKWTEEKKDYLIENYEEKTAKEIAETLGCTASSVWNQAGELNLTGSKPGYNPWTPEEETLLRENAHLEKKEELMSLFKDRTWLSISKKAERENISLSCLGHEYWTPEEVNLLRNYYIFKTATEIQEEVFPNRTKQAVRSKVGKLDLPYKKHPKKKVRKWTSAEELFLKRNYKTMTVKEMAESLDRTGSSIASKKRALGLVKKRNVRKWTEEEEFFLKKFVGKRSVEQFSKKFGRKKENVVWKLEDLGLKYKISFLSWKDINLYFGDLVSYHAFKQWPEMGLNTQKPYSKVKTIFFSKEQLRRFLIERPEAVNLYEVPEESLEELEIDLEDWPEIPVFKKICCDGKHRTRKAHPPYINYVLLFKKRNHCKKCGGALSQWATDGYSNELPEEE